MNCETVAVQMKLLREVCIVKELQTSITETHIHSQMCMRTSLSKGICTSAYTAHKHSTCACWYFTTIRSDLLAARGYSICLPAQDAWIKDKHTQIQEMFLHHRKT